jgi:hypothetical protein
MASSGMCRHVVIVEAGVLEERIASNVWVKMFIRKSVPTRTTRRHISEDDNLHSQRRGNLKS